MGGSEHKVADLPPSAKLVYKVLQCEIELTQKELVHETRLSQRTVRYALDRLTSIGVVEEDIYFPDARQSVYRLTDACTICE